MTVWRTMRRCAPWLLGLFVIAQAAGVVPLLALHAADAFEQAGTQLNLVKARAPATPLHHEHQGNGGDVRDECCAVHHHLAGVLPHPLDAVAIAFVAARMSAPGIAPVETAIPNLPDRPPKLLSLV